MADDPSSGAAVPAKPAPSAGDVINLKWVVEKCALPLALILLPISFQFMAAYQAEKNQELQARKDREDQKFQLYTNLLSKREEADTSVRRGLFDKLIGTYFQPNPTDPYTKLVQLELLALNFHDAMNLNPLFWELHRSIERMPQGARRVELRDQLDRVARQVKDRQMALLEVDGFRDQFDLQLDAVFPGASPWSKTSKAPRLGQDLARGSPARREFTLAVTDHDAKNRRLFVTVSSPGLDGPLGFWLDPFDFPLVNFARLSPTERVAVVLDSYDVPNGVARLVLLYYPSSRSAAKDKPYIEDLINKLLPTPVGEKAAAAPGAAGSETLRK